MNLVIFDIDGTVVNSVAADDECFIQTFRDLHQIDLLGSNWSDFEHVTDSGLTNEIFQSRLNRFPADEEVKNIQNYFFDLLSLRQSEFKEIRGASDFIVKLGEREDFFVAFATGGWGRTAWLKLQCLGLPMKNYIIRSADDHFKRTEITKLAIEASKEKVGNKKFESITYFGDGQWDLEASKELNINFIGVDSDGNEKLNDLGAEIVIRDYQKADEKLVIKPASCRSEG
ncbi:HAD family hydrolase [Reichenbachiella sp.]|uniref:HAD family hydrolase n=1 Tax=Reichenbachiella sp. TaxID=2184521 RepID=UPI003BAFD147